MAAAQVLALQPRVPELRESSPKQGLADSPLVLRTFFFPHVSPFEDNRFERCIQSDGGRDAHANSCNGCG